MVESELPVFPDVAERGARVAAAEIRAFLLEHPVPRRARVIDAQRRLGTHLGDGWVIFDDEDEPVRVDPDSLAVVPSPSIERSRRIEHAPVDLDAADVIDLRERATSDLDDFDDLGGLGTRTP